MTCVVSFDMVAVFYPMIVFGMKNPASFDGEGGSVSRGVVLADESILLFQKVLNAPIIVEPTYEQL